MQRRAVAPARDPPPCRAKDTRRGWGTRGANFPSSTQDPRIAAGSRGSVVCGQVGVEQEGDCGGYQAEGEKDDCFPDQGSFCGQFFWCGVAAEDGFEEKVESFTVSFARCFQGLRVWGL